MGLVNEILNFVWISHVLSLNLSWLLLVFSLIQILIEIFSLSNRFAMAKLVQLSLN